MRAYGIDVILGQVFHGEGAVCVVSLLVGSSQRQIDGVGMKNGVRFTYARLSFLAVVDVRV
jgi:hypothetical protein